jgi:hypothetical protein
MRSCTARIRPMRPHGDTEIACELDGDHPGWHQGRLLNYAYLGSVSALTWSHHDRRSYSGEFVECPMSGCVLPANHASRCTS